MATSAKKLTAKDIFDLYKGWHDKKYPDWNYVPQGFIGNELSAIKKVAEEHGTYKTLCALFIGLRDSSRPTTATYLMKGYWNYLPDCEHPDLYYHVLTRGSDNDKLVWRQLMHVETKWFPTADDLAKKNKLIETLEESFNGKKKKARAKKTQNKSTESTPTGE